MDTGKYVFGLNKNDHQILLFIDVYVLSVTTNIINVFKFGVLHHMSNS